LAQNNSDWNKLKIINTKENIYVYHNGLLKINIPKASKNSTSISQVGVYTFNTRAEFDPVNIGWATQNLSRLLLPNKTIILNGSNTVWSEPLQQNATYIEGSFRMIEGKNTSVDHHAGLVWKDGENTSYSVVMRPSSLSIVSSVSGELAGVSLAQNNSDWNKLKIINTKENIYVYHNNTLLKIKVLRDSHSPLISQVGVYTFNTRAEFDPMKIGWTQ
jgi:hypothetical protein